MKNSFSKIAVTLTLCSLALSGCGKKEKTELPKSIAQIQAEQGIPVRVIQGKIQPITEIRKYSGGIQGADMTMIKAPVSERIVKLHIKVGSMVQKDQVVAELETEGNSPNYRNAKAGLEMLEKSYERMKAVFEKGGVTQQQLDEVETQLKMARTNFASLTKATTLTSTETGVVTDLFYKEGQTPQAESYIASISKLDKLLLTLNITSQEIHRFKLGMSVFIKSNDPGLNESEGLIEGRITEVPLAANPMTRFFPVEVTFYNKKRQLLPNIFVEASVRMRTDTSLCIPNDALIYESGSYSVFRVNQDKAERVEVRPGIISDQFTQILDGLSPEDLIAIDGLSSLRSGVKVKVVQ